MDITNERRPRFTGARATPNREWSEREMFDTPYFRSHILSIASTKTLAGIFHSSFFFAVLSHLTTATLDIDGKIIRLKKTFKRIKTEGYPWTYKKRSKSDRSVQGCCPRQIKIQRRMAFSSRVRVLFQRRSGKSRRE